MLKITWIALLFILSAPVISETKSTAIIVLNDQYVKSNGKQLDWVRKAPGIKFEVNGHKFKREIYTPVSDIDCILPRICIISDFPTAQKYHINGEIDSINTWPRRFAENTVCRYGTRCELTSNGAVQGYIWIREAREGQCVRPEQGEEYYDILATMLALKAMKTGRVKPDIAGFKLSLNDKRIAIILDRTHRKALDAVMFAWDNVVTIQGGGSNKIMNLANKLAKKPYKEVLEELKTTFHEYFDEVEVQIDGGLKDIANVRCN